MPERDLRVVRDAGELEEPTRLRDPDRPGARAQRPDSVVEPMRNQVVLRDLVVDQEPFWRQYDLIQPHLILDPRQPMPEGKENPDDAPRRSNGSRRRRGASPAPPVIPRAPRSRPTLDFPGPMALAKLYRFVVDPRDAGDTRTASSRIQPGGSGPACDATSAPRRARRTSRPSERIRDLKEMAIAVQGGTEHGSRHAIGFKDNIRERGPLNEGEVDPADVGSSGGCSDSSGRGSGSTGKKPEILRAPHRIEGLDEVRKIYEALDRKEGDTS